MPASPVARVTRPATRRFFERHWSAIVGRLPAAVRDHLAGERRVVRGILGVGRYDVVLEVGCAGGDLLLPEVIAGGLRYVGIDLAEGAVRAARRRADDAVRAGSRDPGRVSVHRADIAELPELARRWGLPGSGLLVAFPFNVFGNLPEPWTVVGRVAERRADLVIGSYDTSDAATALRAEYYRACGLRGTMAADEHGVRFRSGAFRSDVHHPEVVRARLSEHGFEVTESRHGVAGLVYWGVCRL